MGYIMKCTKCGKTLEDDDFDVCISCEDREEKDRQYNVKTRTFKRTDSNKTSHRTKKRHTKPRKEEKKE